MIEMIYLDGCDNLKQLGRPERSDNLKTRRTLKNWNWLVLFWGLSTYENWKYEHVELEERKEENKKTIKISNIIVHNKLLCLLGVGAYFWFSHVYSFWITHNILIFTNNRSFHFRIIIICYRMYVCRLLRLSKSDVQHENENYTKNKKIHLMSFDIL